MGGLNMKEESATYTLLSLVWDQACDYRSFSWSRLNHSMRAALQLAIGCFQFSDDDFARIETDFRYNRWNNENCGEDDYAMAVAENNVSACLSFERWKGRKPFIARDVEPRCHRQLSHSVGTRQTCRLCLGARFFWRGEEVTVTSISWDRVVACSYRVKKDTNYQRQKVLHRYTITREALLKERHRTQLVEQIIAAADPARNAILKSLQLSRKSTWRDVANVPIERLREAVEKFCGEEVKTFLEDDKR
jgi:hypothetical protein